MDQGGEFYNNLKILSLFKKFVYDVLPTCADSSFQNGPIECAHQTVSQGNKSLLIVENLDIKFWPYAFIHVLCIQNVLPSQWQSDSTLFYQLDRRKNFTIFKFLVVLFR